MNQEKYNPVNHCKIIRRRTQSSMTSLTYVGGNSEMLPIDLIIEILHRLPAKTIAKLCCVSKQWGFLT
ncbi:BnaA05g35830D [Brassica napus]|uniref:BnaA05g35830D protein n=1 Tax=Brassica napus TaxID=3708 RepID=A0A078JYE9_BRANA|nr:BnaA05g35830D [Brassica napus]